MSEHYYTREPECASAPASCQYIYRGREFTFRTDAGVFSRGEIDAGTDALLRALPGSVSGRVLDIGCGYGAVGVTVGGTFPDTRIVMSDVNLRALRLAGQNARDNGVEAQTLESDGLDALEGDFDLILLNPPIRAGKPVIYRLFKDGAARLNPGGSLMIVIRKRQGADSAEAYLKTLFTKVETIYKSGGYHVIRCGEGRS